MKKILHYILAAGFAVNACNSSKNVSTNYSKVSMETSEIPVIEATQKKILTPEETQRRHAKVVLDNCLGFGEAGIKQRVYCDTNGDDIIDMAVAIQEYPDDSKEVLRALMSDYDTAIKCPAEYIPPGVGIKINKENCRVYRDRSSPLENEFKN